jgi:iron(III) transport system ATP-binding protein
MLRVENLTKTYGIADGGGIRDISLEVAEGEFFTLLGPSGCGKTTTLRSVAGLEQPSAGRVTLAGRVIFDWARGVFVPANQRRLGMVFQSYAVWPHMSVYENAAFPLRMAPRHGNDPDIRLRVMRTLETMGLAGFADRSAAQLSGGEQQRLALARALVAEPRLLLLDEPLSNLDAQLREQMRSELRRLQKEVGVTAIYVTHDQAEALALSDRIAVMNDGAVAQIGTPQDIYHQPTDAFVATFVGRSNLLRGKLLQPDTGDGSVRIETVLGAVLCRASQAAAAGVPGAALIRPEHIVLTPAAGAGEPILNRFRGRVAHTAFLGETVERLVRVGKTEILVRSFAGQYDGPDEVDEFFPPEKTLAISVGS